MTLNGRNVTLAEIKKVLRSPPKKFNEDRPIVSAAKCRPMILVSRNIRYMRIFAGVPRTRGVKYGTVSLYLRPNFEQEHVFITYK